MNEDEILEIKEYHFKKIRRLCQEYIDRELDYKIGVTDDRLIEVWTLIEN